MSRIRDFVRYMRVLKTQQENDTVETATVNSTSVNADALIASSIDLNGEVTEQVYTLIGTNLDPSNGTIQLCTLAANTTLTSSLVDGESLTLMIEAGGSYTVTWPIMQWAGGTAPTLAASGYTVVTLWQANGVMYGSSIGDMA